MVNCTRNHAITSTDCLHFYLFAAGLSTKCYVHWEQDLRTLLSNADLSYPTASPAFQHLRNVLVQRLN